LVIRGGRKPLIVESICNFADALIELTPKPNDAEIALKYAFADAVPPPPI